MPREMDDRMNMWIGRDLKQRIREKANKEHINISAMARSWFLAWLEGTMEVGHGTVGDGSGEGQGESGESQG